MKKFEIGEVVKVKSWDEMCEEFTEDYSGMGMMSTLGLLFHKKMKYLCGQEITIEKLACNGDRFLVFDSKECFSWQLDRSMVCDLVSESELRANTESFLGGFVVC